MSDTPTNAEVQAEILESIDDGIASSSTDGLTTNYVDPLKRLEALEKLNALQARESAKSQPHFGLRMTKLKPPGGG